MSNGKQLIDGNDVKDHLKKIRLNEWVTRDTVSNAIKNHDVVFIYYAGDDTVNKGFRTIEPYVLGISRAGNPVLRAWQQAGATDRGTRPVRVNDEIPGWRLFRLDGITSMVRTLRKFDVDPEYLKSHRPHYNPDDRQMTDVITAIQPIEKGQTTVSGDTSITKPDVQVSQPTGFFKNQADKFRNFFRKPADFSTTWIENQKRHFKELLKRNKQQ